VERGIYEGDRFRLRIILDAIYQHRLVEQRDRIGLWPKATSVKCRKVWSVTAAC